jgi:SAM-dependent methyltransferase
VGVFLETAAGTPSDWVMRWSHLVPGGCEVLDVACGGGRHIDWFLRRGHAVTGVDIDLQAASPYAARAKLVRADLEHEAWPLMEAGRPKRFGAVVVTNYLWRPLFELLVQSLTPNGILIYETFALGNQSVGRPRRAEFLLREGELLTQCKGLRVVAYENGFLERPERFVQRIVAVQPDTGLAVPAEPARYPL